MVAAPPSAAAFHCMQCGGRAGTLRYADCWDHYLGKPYRADYRACDACGLVQQSPVPEDVADFYDAYPIHARKSGPYEAFRAIVMRASYFDLRRFVAGWRGTAPPVVVDFGCGDGWFLGANGGLPATRIGYELDPAVAGHLAGQLGMPVYSDEGALLAAWGGKADLVTMHFVMEHVTDLHRTFRVVAGLLKPGGTFHFVVPNIASWEARLFGRRWHNLDCPRHVSFPEAGPVRALAARWGFALAGERKVPFPNGIAGSVPVVLTGRFRFPLFLAALPLGILLSRLFPGGNKAYRLVRGHDAAARAVT